MGRVFRAHDELLDRDVALKLIYSEALADEELSRECAAEARVAASLTHQGIARVLDSGFDDGRCFVVSELVEGQTLSALLAEHGPLPVRQALDLAIQVADALDAIHKHGIVHCDVKPSNAIVNADNQAKLVDFGIARMTATTGLTGLTGEPLRGSAEYVAPEQVQGDHMDRRIDIYALGIVLYEMLAGKTPFSGGSVASVVARRLVMDPPSLADQVSGVSEALDRVVDRALARDPDLRFQTAGELRDALMAVRNGDPVAAPIHAPAPGEHPGAYWTLIPPTRASRAQTTTWARLQQAGHAINQGIDWLVASEAGRRAHLSRRGLGAAGVMLSLAPVVLVLALLRPTVATSPEATQSAPAVVVAVQATPTPLAFAQEAPATATAPPPTEAPAAVEPTAEPTAPVTVQEPAPVTQPRARAIPPPAPAPPVEPTAVEPTEAEAAAQEAAAQEAAAAEQPPTPAPPTPKPTVQPLPTVEDPGTRPLRTWPIPTQPSAAPVAPARAAPAQAAPAQAAPQQAAPPPAQTQPQAAPSRRDDDARPASRESTQPRASPPREQQAKPEQKPSNAPSGKDTDKDDRDQEKSRNRGGGNDKKR